MGDELMTAYKREWKNFRLPMFLIVIIGLTLAIVITTQKESAINVFDSYVTIISYVIPILMVTWYLLSRGQTRGGPKYLLWLTVADTMIMTGVLTAWLLIWIFFSYLSLLGVLLIWVRLLLYLALILMVILYVDTTTRRSFVTSLVGVSVMLVLTTLHQFPVDSWFLNLKLLPSHLIGDVPSYAALDFRFGEMLSTVFMTLLLIYVLVRLVRGKGRIL